MEENRVIKGRGSPANPSSRFLSESVVPTDDGWNVEQTFPDEYSTRGPQTELIPDKTKSLISTNQSPDVPFDQSINPYKGCEHGCIYCYARPTHAYLDLSPGLDFETKIFYKTQPVARLRQVLDNPRYVCKPIALGTNTDPYQPAERELEVTRSILETLIEYRHPVSIVTKGVLVLRDIDLLQELASLNLINVAISVTTLSIDLKNKMEPRATSPSTRLRMIHSLAKAEIPVGVMVAPIVPILNDGELEEILERCSEAGAQFAGYVIVRLPLEVKDLFQKWLQKHYPLQASRVMNRIRDLHLGNENGGDFGTRMRGSGVFAELIGGRFERACAKFGFPTSGAKKAKGSMNGNLFVNATSRTPLRTDLFRSEPNQTDLFD